MRNRLFINSASGTLLFLLNLAIAFILSPIMVRQLGNRDYGIWDLLLGLCGYLGLLEVGVGPAIIRFIAKSASQENTLEMRRTYITALFALTTTGVLCLGLMSLISLNPYSILNLHRQESPHLPLLCVLGGANLGVHFTGMASSAYLMGLQQHYRINVLRILLAVISAASTYAALVYGGGNRLVLLSSILLAGNIIQYTIIYLWAARHLGIWGTSPQYFSKYSLKALLTFGINSFLLMLSGRIQRQSIPFVISHTLGIATIVFYSIPNRLSEYAINLLAAAGFPLSPLFSALEAKSGMDAARDLWIQTNRWQEILMTLLALGLGFLGADFIGLWIGPEYAEKGNLIIIFLCVAMFIGGLAPNSNRLLIALGKHGEVALKLLALSVAVVLAAIAAAHTSGLPGVAAAVSLGNIGATVICWRKACIFLRISLASYLRKTLMALLPPSIVFSAIHMLLSLTIQPDTYATLGLHVVAASIGYMVVAWYFSLDKMERVAIGSRISLLFRQSPVG